jgi:hypothetical protein
MTPSPNGDNGRDEQGRFTAGNNGGPGNPHAAQVGRLRTALLNAVTEDDMREVVLALVGKAKTGDVVAARVLFDRVLGKPIEADLIARIEALEEHVGGES